MTIRKAEPGDLDAVYALIQDAILAMREQGIDQWDELYPAREDLSGDIRQRTLYTVWDDDHLAAIFVISTECDAAYKTCVWEREDITACILHRLCVAPAYQHRGTGTAVLSLAEETAAKTGYRSIRLDVFTQNPAALRLYEKNGYVPRGEARWRKGRFLLMEKGL